MGMGGMGWGIWGCPPSHLADVGVGVLGVDAAVLPDVLEGVGHVATPAAVVVGHAIHQVLGAEGQQFPSFPLQLPLQGAH